MGRARRLRYRHLRRTIIAVLATVAAFLLVALIGRMLLTAGPYPPPCYASWIVAVAEQRGFDLEIEQSVLGFLPPQAPAHRCPGRGSGSPRRNRNRRGRAGEDLVHQPDHRARHRRRRWRQGCALDGTPREHRRGVQAQVQVRHLELTRIDFEGTGLPGRIDLAFDGLDAGWSSEDGAPTGFVRIDRTDLRIPGLNPITAALAARLRIEDGVQIPSWTADADGIALVGEGAVGGDVGTSFTARGTIDLEELDRIVKAGNILSGIIDIDAVFDPAAEEPLRVEVRRAACRPQVFRSTMSRVVSCSPMVQFRGEIDRAGFFGGRLNGNYLGTLGGSFPHSVRVNGRGVEVAGILGSIGISSAGISAVLDTDVVIDWNGRSSPSDRVAPTHSSVPPMAPCPPRARSPSNSTGTVRSPSPPKVCRSAIPPSSWQGPLAIGTWQPSWSVNATPAVLEEIVPMVNAWIGSRALPAVEGSGRLQVSLSGPWDELLVNTRLDARPLRWVRSVSTTWWPRPSSEDSA